MLSTLVIAALAQPVATPLEPPPASSSSAPAAVTCLPPTQEVRSPRARRWGMGLAIGSGVMMAGTAAILWGRQRALALEEGDYQTSHDACTQWGDCSGGWDFPTPRAEITHAAFSVWPFLPTAVGIELAVGAGALLAYGRPATPVAAQSERAWGGALTAIGVASWVVGRFRRPPSACLEIPHDHEQEVRSCYASWFDLQSSLYVLGASSTAIGAGLLTHSLTSKRLYRLAPQVAASRGNAMLGLSLRF